MSPCASCDLLEFGLELPDHELFVRNLPERLLDQISDQARIEEKNFPGREIEILVGKDTREVSAVHRHGPTQMANEVFPGAPGLENKCSRTEIPGIETRQIGRVGQAKA